jgi:hypothetical protein
MLERVGLSVEWATILLAVFFCLESDFGVK